MLLKWKGKGWITESRTFSSVQSWEPLSAVEMKLLPRVNPSQLAIKICFTLQGFLQFCEPNWWSAMCRCLIFA